MENQSNAYVRLGTSHGQPPALEGPIPYEMSGGKLSWGGLVPDITPGRWNSDMIVSARVREIIQDLDPIPHHFIPLELVLKKRTKVSTHFLFVAGDLTDAIIAEQSEVTPKIFDEKLAYYSVPGTPKIVWNAEATSGRAIWVDRFLRRQFVISDELQSTFEAQRIERYEITPSFIAIKPETGIR